MLWVMEYADGNEAVGLLESVPSIPTTVVSLEFLRNELLNKELLLWGNSKGKGMDLSFGSVFVQHRAQ